MSPPDTSAAFYGFLGGRDAPYLFQAPGGPVRVFAVTSKTGFAAARTVGLAHAVTGMAGTLSGSCIIYAARWVCVGGSVDAVILPEPDIGICHVCAAKIADDGPGVYRLLGHGGELLYVGSSARVRERISQHKRMRRWRGLLADAIFETYQTVPEARAAELRAIRTENPLHNKLCANPDTGAA